MNSLNLEISTHAPRQALPEPHATSAPTIAPSGAPKKLPTIQMLRGLAAALVVLHHAAGVVPTNAGHTSWLVNHRLPLAGASGVDIFFVISGFIMFYTTTRKAGAKAAADFLWKRALRIYPLYWVWTSVLVLIAVLKLIPANHLHPLEFYIASYLLAPVYNGFNFHPFLDQGWTLSFEMLFYLVFAIGIWLTPGRSILPFLTVSFAGLLLVSLLFPQGSGLKYLLSNSLIVEFLFGVALAKLFLAAHRSPRRPVAPAGMLVALAVVGFSLLLSTTWLPASYEGLTTSPWRCVYWGIPSALIVTGFAGCNQELTRSALVFLGDASYSTYLTHNFILGIFQRFVFRRPSFLPCLYADLEIIAVCLITILLTLPAYLCIERPLTSWLQSLTSPKRALLLARRS